MEKWDRKYVDSHYVSLGRTKRPLTEDERRVVHALEWELGHDWVEIARRLGNAADAYGSNATGTVMDGTDKGSSVACVKSGASPSPPGRYAPWACRPNELEMRTHPGPVPRPALDHELEDPSSPVVATAQVTHPSLSRPPSKRRDLEKDGAAGVEGGSD